MVKPACVPQDCTFTLPDLCRAPKGFDPEATFLCGQCFRWVRDEAGVWHGLSGDHAIELTMQGDEYCLSGADAQTLHTVWIPYLGWDEDDAPMKQQLAEADPVMAAAIAHAPGLRLLRQDPWETLATFLISQNNGIPRIRQIVESLCACFGSPPAWNETAEPCFFPAPSTESPKERKSVDPPSTLLRNRNRFPSFERLAALSEKDLQVCRAGYRTAYLLRTARQLMEGHVLLDRLGDMPYASAREELLHLHGVGIKVADCTLLFSGTHREAFPVDRWVIRIMNNLYPGSGKDTKDLQHFAASHWGPLAGLAQEFLFHYARTGVY